MLALIAMIIFILYAFKVVVGSLNLLAWGLVFLSAHVALTGFWYQWPARRPPV